MHAQQKTQKSEEVPQLLASSPSHENRNYLKRPGSLALIRNLPNLWCRIFLYRTSMHQLTCPATYLPPAETHPDNVLDLLDVCRPVLLEHVKGLGLGRRIGVGVIEEVLDAQKDLLDGDGGLPGLVLVQDAETHGAGGVYVGVEKRRHELAWRQTTKLAHLNRVKKSLGAGCLYTWEAWWGTLREWWVSEHVETRRKSILTVREDHVELEKTALPVCSLLAGDAAGPLHEVEAAGGGFRWLSIETEGVILAPLLAGDHVSVESTRQTRRGA